MNIESFRTDSLGDTTYVLSHQGYALVIDPQRDIERFFPGTEASTVTHVVETHVHNDYVSGGRDLARRTGADLVLPAGSGASFPFVPAFHNEDIGSESGLSIRPLHTPGHTPEHMSYLVLLNGRRHAVFTGGSLLVGSAGRSDLLGLEFARQLAILQFGSLARLAALPDEVGVFPTHGEGSFCSVGSAGRTTSTIGHEKAENPLYRHTNAEAFADAQLANLLPYPDYYPEMAPINRTDPTAVARVTVRELPPGEVAELMEETSILDGRPRSDFAAAHVPGSVGIELGDSFAPWAGWLLPFNASIILVLNPDQSAEDAAIELARIGFTNVRGVMRGVAEWARAGFPVRSHQVTTANDLRRGLAAGEDIQVLDVRDPQERRDGHIEGSIHRYVPDLRSGIGRLDPTRPVWVICGTGLRASIAAGLLETHGVEPVVVATGGVAEVLAPG